MGTQGLGGGAGSRCLGLDLWACGLASVIQEPGGPGGPPESDRGGDHLISRQMFVSITSCLQTGEGSWPPLPGHTTSLSSARPGPGLRLHSRLKQDLGISIVLSYSYMSPPTPRGRVLCCQPASCRSAGTAQHRSRLSPSVRPGGFGAGEYAAINGVPNNINSIFT